MDDDMEDEIIREIASAHFHLIWKYVSMTSSGLAEIVLPGPGESFKSKLLQPMPFMLFTFVIIISSIFLQTRNNWLEKVLFSCHKTISLKAVADHSFKSFVATASIAGDNVTQDLTEGIVGVYALQGRRGNMEDRFSVLQEVDVGGPSKLSFFGVYDGHGGQFVAEYVKQNLFMNTVQKIRQLRKDKNENNRKLKRENSNESSRRRKGSTPTVNLLGEKLPITKERRVSTSSSLDGNLNIVKEELDDLNSGEKEKENTSEKTEVKISPTTGNEEQSAGCKVEEVKAEDKCEAKAQDKEPCTQSLKKDDPYTSVSIKKRSSFGNSSDTASAKETESKAADTTDSCIDLNCNVNYTKLLTDQIMDIDKKLVDFCKSRTDLSGSTAVVAVVDGELLIIGNVGDSRAVMGDLKGSTIPLSFDHKPNQLKERRRIKEAGGFITFTGVWRVAGILATSRALGDFPLKDPRKLITAEPDVLTFSLKDHKAHFVILATDGLWDVMSNEEAVAFVRSHIHERDFGSRSLVLHAYDKGSTDNITVLIINLSKLNL